MQYCWCSPFLVNVKKCCQTINRIQNQGFCLHNMCVYCVYLLYIYIYIYIYMCIYINTHTCMYIFKKDLHVFTCIYLYSYKLDQIYIKKNYLIHKRKHFLKYIHACVCIYLYIYIYIYIYTHTYIYIYIINIHSANSYIMYTKTLILDAINHD